MELNFSLDDDYYLSDDTGGAFIDDEDAVLIDCEQETHPTDKADENSMYPDRNDNSLT